MRRDTRLDGLPLATVVVLCALLLAWMARGDRGIQAWAGTSDARFDLPQVADLDALEAPAPTPWGGRTVGELLERVLDPAAGRSALRAPVPPTEDGDPLCSEPVQGPPAPRPFTLTGAGGVVLAEGLLVDGQPQGTWVFRHPDGEQRAQGAFQAGAPDGVWEAWHEDGTPRARLRYERGTAAGERVDWWPNGTRSLQGSYLAGRREGLWHTWHENGRLRWEGRYLAGLREGTWREWHANGAPASEATYVQGRREGLYRAWYPDRKPAQQGWFVDGRREGLWAFFGSDGGRDRRSGLYLAGVLQRQ